jgi:hypothetical protein
MQGNFGSGYRLMLVLAICSMTLHGPGEAQEADVPREDADDAVRIVVPCPAGSAADALAHSIAKMLASGSGMTVIVENDVLGNEPDNHRVAQDVRDRKKIYLMPMDRGSPAVCGE